MPLVPDACGSSLGAAGMQLDVPARIGQVGRMWLVMALGGVWDGARAGGLAAASGGADCDGSSRGAGYCCGTMPV
jgi:hypothetical protein